MLQILRGLSGLSGAVPRREKWRWPSAPNPALISVIHLPCRVSMADRLRQERLVHYNQLRGATVTSPWPTAGCHRGLVGPRLPEHIGGPSSRSRAPHHIANRSGVSESKPPLTHPTPKGQSSQPDVPSVHSEDASIV
jgi:hypothetical protein